MFAKMSREPATPNNFQKNLRQVWRLISNKQFVDALDILDALMLKTDRHLYARAQCLAGLKQYSDAVICLLQIQYLSIQHKRCLGFCYRNQGEYDKALRILYTIPRGWRGREVLYDMARIHQENGDYQKAINFYTSIEGWMHDAGISGRLADCNLKLDSENVDNEIKPVFSWEYIRGNTNPHTFFRFYNSGLGKGISAYTFEKAGFMHVLKDDLEQELRKGYKHLPHIEGLDLAEPDSRTPGMS